MSLILPYTFTGGTSAKAQEVNANFQQVKKFVDKLESDAETMAQNIEDLIANKANLNGARAQTFEVANPTSSYQAVNKQYLEAQLAVFATVINGLKMTITGNTTFNIAPGGCFDSTYLHPMVLRTNLAVDVSDKNPSTVYKIFVIASTDNSTIARAEVTTGTPSISSTTIYRQLGTVTLDSSGNITAITQGDN